MKRILCFFDGTWNSADDTAITNVVKLCRAVPEIARDGVRQVAHYIVGIATEKGYGDLKFAAGAVGWGVAERILTGYRELAKSYVPGDEIYVFGFSRGAYQARSLAGFVSLVGVLAPDNLGRVEEAWTHYRQHGGDTAQPGLAQLRALGTWPARIRLVGVWDTVGNLGLPFAVTTDISRDLAFHSSELSPNVDVGLHALSIDEPRGSFSPTFWTARKGAALPEGQIVEQVWFPGDHANVGGGWPDSALSDISLLWMAERAVATTGVDIDIGRLARDAAPDPLGLAVLPTSDRLFRVNNFLPYVRLIGQNRRGIAPMRRTFLGSWRVGVLPSSVSVVGENVHPSAVARFGKLVPLRYAEDTQRVVYEPRPLAVALGKV